MSEDWSAVRIKKARLDHINKFLKTKDAKEQGITNAADFVESAVKEMIKKFESRRFEHFNFHDNIIRVLDNSIGDRGDIVELRKHGNELACGYCENTKCVHVKFVWSDPDLILELKKAGLRAPF